MNPPSDEGMSETAKPAVELAPPAPVESIAAPVPIAVPISTADESPGGLPVLDAGPTDSPPVEPDQTVTPVDPAAEVPTRTAAIPTTPRQPSRPPPWIDALIFIFTSLLVLMIARRMST